MNQKLRLLLLAQLIVCVLGIFGCGGDDDENECAEAKKVQMDAVRSKCGESQYVDCCYCLCELTDNATCGCENFVLIKDVDVSNCEGTELNDALNCLNNRENCMNKIKNPIASVRCR
ncbi:MAG: hypothetical protein JXA30_02655 [Deltaproteobacteria bacterium]|nr:hypothetical protein [Deltaproteobacteria bacterium]